MGLFSSSTDTTSKSGINVAPETALEKQATGSLSGGLTGLEGVVGAGAGSNEAASALAGTKDYTDLLGRLGQGQGLMQAQQAGIEGYSALGNQLYGGLMRQQTAQAQQMAARQGRGMSDLMLQNKLGQQRNDLVGSFAVQHAMQAPSQQAQYMGQRAEAMQGLASQAMANRQALLGMGSQLRESDRSYRIATGERYSNSSTTSNPSMMANLGAIASIAGTVMGGPLGGMLGGMLSKGLSGGGGSSTPGNLSQSPELSSLNSAPGGVPSRDASMAELMGAGNGSYGGQGQQFTGNSGGYGGGPTPGGGAMGLGGYGSDNPIMGGRGFDYSAPVGQGAGPNGYDQFQGSAAQSSGRIPRRY